MAKKKIFAERPCPSSRQRGSLPRPKFAESLTGLSAKKTVLAPSDSLPRAPARLSAKSPLCRESAYAESKAKACLPGVFLRRELVWANFEFAESPIESSLQTSKL